ncbi:class I SAM-dependent DNA methyltransferase [Ruania suaedae]|uniref:class I SAM-dependent DNA methyltransferase n=1 Tax=Ruania suaedae TaxID=2897774 RepID=UPI001E39E55B|nr:class I SAM-dependent DNA methyltransferase [Ruania suaedae]UFU01876.1 class I SAM-dependent DNA methyltransferase [Ruania suaedae]
MMASDAIVVGEDWISEHYLSSDAKGTFKARVTDRRKEWDAAAKDGHDTTRSRFLATRQDLLRTFAGLDESGPGPLTGLYENLRTVLGYDALGLATERTGPVLAISSPGLTDGAPLVIIEATAAHDVTELLAKDEPTLLTPYALEDGEEITSVARLLSHLFVSDDAPEFALVLAGGLALVAEKVRWAEGRYLAIDLQVVAERGDDARGSETDRALTCLDARSLAPGTEGSIWWHEVLEESVKHTVGVSQDLREGVRLSIEIIANEVVRRRAAQALPPLPDEQAQPLAKQSLRFLYRILFLLYAEASPELGVLPTGDPVYERGYSLDRLRELTLVEIVDDRDAAGTHLYDSLALLFRMVDQGSPQPREPEPDTEDGTATALVFRPLKADLFENAATALIDETGLGNRALQQVLQHLLLSKERKGRDRGFISYAELGINQLGAVYEGLMSYTGFFASEDLYEVAKDGNGEKGSWVVPVDRADGISRKDFLYTTDPVTGEQTPVLHERGTFVFRLAGRERQQSASYYTPEVLTRFTVSQALAELLDQPDADGNERRTTAREILDLTVCEPALGSGAFAIEAVRQLAAEYLTRRQEETGERIDPDDYPRELQKVKAYLALHQVYGVDLNATAVELAEISLWLDTMGEGLAAPWFGLHLRRGNSLIGARRAVYARHQLAKRAWLKSVPDDAPLSSGLGLTSGGVDGRIHHFLLPAAGWGSAVEAKEAKELAPEALHRLKDWRRSVMAKPNGTQEKALVNLGHRVEALWDLAHRRLQIAEQEIRRSIDIWGADDLPVGGAVTRGQIESALADANGAYRRLRLVMDAWCALWFWPLTDELTTTTVDGEIERIQPPTLDQWIAGLRAVLGTHVEAGATGSGRRWRGGDQTLAAGVTWDELGDVERLDLGFANAVSPDRFLADHPWLRVCQQIAERQGFFHWELDFAPVFAERGGFDLQVGNPPWVRPRSDVEALLAEGDPWWQLKGKATQSEVKMRRAQTLSLSGLESLVIDGTADVAVTAAYVGDGANYPHLVGLQPDLYRCFMAQVWQHQSTHGISALIHLESHFTDEKGGQLRAATYERLRRHWQFINEYLLFEIEDHKRYGVHVYGKNREPKFLQAASIYHPSTVERSLEHDGSGPEPGIKDSEGRWDASPHSFRIVRVDREVLQTWHELLESDDVPLLMTRMVYAVNGSTATVLDKIAEAPRIVELDLTFSRGWDESIDRRKGFFDSEWGEPTSWREAILQGPHLHVAIPAFKTPNRTMKHNQDWSAVDLEALEPDAIPATSYKPRGDRAEYDRAYTHWTRDVVLGPDGQPVDPVPTVDPRYVRHVETATRGDGTTARTETISARGFYRLAWRRMAANTGERTLIPALIPPGAAHVDGVFSAVAQSSLDLVTLAGFAGSLVLDFVTRAVPKGDIRAGSFSRLPMVAESPYAEGIRLRTLRLSCVSRAYADLWAECYAPVFREDRWTGLPERTGWVDLGDVGPDWTPETPLRRAEDRRQAMLEIDALVALSLGLTADELCTIYRTQFPVLYGYDRNRDHYDANGRLVPNEVLSVWRKKGQNEGRYTDDDLTATHPGSGVDYLYELPFETLDREAHMRRAYAQFERVVVGSKEDSRS